MSNYTPRQIASIGKQYTFTMQPGGMAPKADPPAAVKGSATEPTREEPKGGNDAVNG